MKREVEYHEVKVSFAVRAGSEHGGGLGDAVREALLTGIGLYEVEDLVVEIDGQEHER